MDEPMSRELVIHEPETPVHADSVTGFYRM
jgi:hypothetical protein